MDKILVIYDGHCALCQGWVKFVLQRDTTDKFRFAALDSMHAQQLGISLSQFGRDETVMVYKDGKLCTHSQAAIVVLTELGGFWAAFQLVQFVPQFIRDTVYRCIARNRYRWFGRLNNCIIPRQEWKHKFLD